MFTELLKSRRFLPLFVCQFLSALNDNFVKTALVILLLYGAGTAGGADNSGVMVTLAGATLIAPFFFLSAVGGELADRYDKAAVARWIKIAEVPIAALAAIGFVTSSVPILFTALFGFGCMAAIFGPLKYGILPDHLETEKLPAANALVEGATFLAILGGTIAGGIAMTNVGAAALVPPWGVALIIVAFASTGYLSARSIPSTRRAVPDLPITKNILSSTFRLIGELRKDKRLWDGGLITSVFWFAGVVALALFPTVVKSALGGSEAVVTAGLVTFVLGIAVGSWLAARASHRRPNLALVPIGALGMGLSAAYAAIVISGLPPVPAGVAFGLDQVAASDNAWHLAAALFALAASGGLFIVPAFAAVQIWSPADRRARTIAAVNIINAAAMTVGSLGLAALQSAGVGLDWLFGGLAVLMFVSTVWIAWLWGREGMRDLAYALFRLFYGIEVKGRENLPAPGERAIIAPNHVSFMDGPMLHSILPDHAAFAIDTGIAKAWWVAPFLKLVKAFTLDPTKPLATRHLVKEVADGQTLVIFPEGRLTVTGGLMKVYDGTAMIADKADAKIIPVRISGMERSSWSYLRKRQTKKVWFPKTTIEILPARKLEIPDELRGKWRRQFAGRALQDVMVETAVATANTDQTLFDALVEAKATRDTGQPIVADPTGVKLGYGKLIIGAQALAAKLQSAHGIAREPGEAVGVMLPNAAGAAVTFFALQSLGAVPAMLNFTAGPKNVLSACTTACVKRVLTSREFVAKAHLEDVIAAIEAHVEIIYLDDVRPTITTADKLKAALRRGVPFAERKPSDPAAILFTSGSEGVPKGVVLSHTNLLSNAMQALTLVTADGEDKVFNVLPVFHAFGLTAGMIMPIVGGIPLFLYPSPLHYRIVPELVYQTNATILFGTDTFLNGYARTAHPYDFDQLRLILAGAEAVKASTRHLYMEKFGVRILEGYGVTECAPVLAINTPLASKAGSVGRLVPLLEAKLDDVPGLEAGKRLSVRGPNVMLGYYRAENPGVLEPPTDGWHDTGDIVDIDRDGFVTIKGRAKRFAKIAGEMVSLSAVEALVSRLWPDAHSVVVTVPDVRKGERLVLLTTNTDPSRPELSAFARSEGATELMVPATLLTVDAIPLLGSGKTDYVGATKLALELTNGAKRAASDVEDIEEAGETKTIVTAGAA
ncbi:MAG: acyl-[ACP]--phospholipid O-acyltransferase [Pseudomonadota bacterium]